MFRGAVRLVGGTAALVGGGLALRALQGAPAALGASPVEIDAVAKRSSNYHDGVFRNLEPASSTSLTRQQQFMLAREVIGGNSNQQRAGEAGARGDRDRVDLLKRQLRLLQCEMHRGHHRLKVSAARDLWHDAAEAGMFLDARSKRVRQQLGAAHDADAGLVARRLDPEHCRRRAHAARSSRMTTASMPLGW